MGQSAKTFLCPTLAMNMFSPWHKTKPYSFSLHFKLSTTDSTQRVEMSPAVCRSIKGTFPFNMYAVMLSLFHHTYVTQKLKSNIIINIQRKENNSVLLCLKPSVILCGVHKNDCCEIKWWKTAGTTSQHLPIYCHLTNYGAILAHLLYITVRIVEDCGSYSHILLLWIKVTQIPFLGLYEFSPLWVVSYLTIEGTSVLIT